LAGAGGRLLTEGIPVLHVRILAARVATNGDEASTPACPWKARHL
jgi:hypothetical protein